VRKAEVVVKLDWKFTRIICLILVICLSVFLFAKQASGEGAGNNFSRDYACLWDALREDYPFIPCIENMGIDVEQIERDYADRTEKCRDVTEFAEIISELFYQMNNLAHLAVVDASSYDEYRDLAEAGVLDAAYRELIFDSETHKTYEFMPRKDKNPTGSKPVPQISYYADERAVYMRIQTFSHACLERDRTVVADVLEQYPAAENVIFDITGNRGGSDYYWMENIVAPFGGEYSYENILYFRDTPLTRRFGLRDKAVELSSPAPIEIIPESIAALNLSHMRVNTVRCPDYGNSEIEWSHLKRWLLIDGGTYSAADGFSAFCREAGWAELIGTQTMGDGGSAAPLMIRLPDTGLLVQFSCAVTLNSDGTVNAIAGTLPDYRPKPKETALEACLRLIRAVNE